MTGHVGGTSGIFIRDFQPGEEAALHAVFFSSVHGLATGEYSQAQLDAWAPVDYDELEWAVRIRRNRPFVVEIGGRVVAYADLQASGHIDQFFVDGAYAGRGAGTALMAHIHQLARQQGQRALSADVSLTAQPFFARHGFLLEERKLVAVRGVTLSNARMRKLLQFGA